MDNIPLGRQEELRWLVEDNVIKTLVILAARRRIAHEELEWMVNLLKTFGFNLPNFLQPDEETSEMSTVIVQRAEDKALDDKYLDIAMDTNDEYMGYAFIEEGEIKHGEMPLENKAEAKEEISATPNHPLILVFDKGLSTEESKQPFVSLSKEDGTPLCVVFLGGDFQGFEAPETSHSTAWACHQQYLMPKIIDTFTDCEEDLDKTFDKLNRALTRGEIINNCFRGTLANGEIVILFANGKVWEHHKGDKHKKYEWGEVSSALGFEGKPINPELTEKVKQGLGARSKTSVPVAGNSKTPNTNKTDTAIAAAMDKAKTGLSYMIEPPAHKLKSKPDAEGWYRAYGDATYGMPSDKELQDMLKDNSKILSVRVKPTLSQNAFDTLVAKKLIVVSSAKAIDKPTETKKTEIPILIIPKGELEMFKKDVWPAVIKPGSEYTNTVEEFLEFYKDKPTASGQHGLQMGAREWEVINSKGFELIGSKTPKTLLSILEEQRNEIHRLRAAIAVATNVNKKAANM